jgi:hypothetical protein
MMSDRNQVSNSKKPVEVIRYSPVTTEPRLGTLRMLMRIALGGAVIARQELRERFQETQTESQIAAVELNRVTPIASETDRVRYAALGAVVNSNQALQRGISKLDKASNRTFRRLTRIAEPLTNSRFAKPFRRRYRRYTDHGEKIVSSWVAAGRREEYLGRQLAQQTATETIEETLDYLAESPEMDELMEQQSIDLVDDVLFDEVRESASNTTLILSNWFNTVILRRKRELDEHPTTSSSDAHHDDQE